MKRLGFSLAFKPARYLFLAVVGVGLIQLAGWLLEPFWERVFGGSRDLALIVQAIVFGLVHMYQGPAGIFGAAINGLIFGGLTLAARGSIWPAAIAHGSSNSIGIMEIYWAG